MRYKTTDKEHKIYSDWYADYKVNSRILNRGKNTPGIYMFIWSPDNIKDEIIRLRGAEIPAIEERLSKYAFQFSRYQERRELEGFEASDEWPDKLLEKRLKDEAKLDGTLQELEILAKMKANIGMQKVEQDD